MRLLLDTHAFLWFVLNDPVLSPEALSLIADPDNEICLSPASHWEIAIKISIGKYQIPGSFETWMNQQLQINEINILPITIAHTAASFTALGRGDTSPPRCGSLQSQALPHVTGIS